MLFRWRVDDDLPGVLGDDRALEVIVHSSYVPYGSIGDCNYSGP